MAEKNKYGQYFTIDLIADFMVSLISHINIEDYLKFIPDTIVSGGARGADTYAMDFARQHGLKLIVFFPDYEKYGRQAPLMRNKLIVEECDCLLAFWDGQAKGTKFTLDYAKEKGKPVKIVQI